MTLKEILKEVYAGFVAKAQKDVEAGEKAIEIASVGNDVIAVGKTWTEAIGDDGKISDAEAKKMNDVFGDVVDRRCPDVSGAALTFVYNGFTVFGIGFKGLKHYLNKWFGIDL